MLVINLLSVISFANIFSHSAGCLFVLSVVSFADNGEGMHEREQTVYGKSLYLPFNFAVNLK